MLNVTDIVPFARLKLSHQTLPNGLGRCRGIHKVCVRVLFRAVALGENEGSEEKCERRVDDADTAGERIADTTGCGCDNCREVSNPVFDD